MYLFPTIHNKLQQYNPWPHVANRHTSISQLLSLWRHSHDDVTLARLRRSQPPFSLWRDSHCDATRYWAGHAHSYGRTYVRYVTDTLPRLIYKDTQQLQLSLAVRLCIRKTLNVCAWGTKYPHVQYQIFSTIGCGLLQEFHFIVQQFKLYRMSCST